MDSQQVAKIIIFICFYFGTPVIQWMSAAAGPTGQFELHSAVVDERPVHPVAEGLEGSDAEQSRLLLAQVLVGPPPERVFSKHSRRDLKNKKKKQNKKKERFFTWCIHKLQEINDTIKTMESNIESFGEVLWFNWLFLFYVNIVY